MLDDLDLFQTKLAKIQGFGNSGDYLRGIVSSKEVKPPRPSTAAENRSEEAQGEATAVTAAHSDSSDDAQQGVADKEKEDGEKTKDGEKADDA